MSQDKKPPTEPAGSTGKLLRCGSCKKTLVPSDAEFFTFVQKGWPHCCGETMALFLEAWKPSPPLKPNES